MSEVEFKEFVWERCEADDKRVEEIWKAVQRMILEARVDEVGKFTLWKPCSERLEDLEAQLKGLEDDHNN